MDNVDFLPRWKKGATPEEFLSECSMMVRKHPEWARKLIVVAYEETDDGKLYKTRLWRHGTESTIDTLGTLEEAKIRFVLETFGL